MPASHSPPPADLRSRRGERTAWVEDGNLAELVDLYELTMIQAYWRAEMLDDAVFSLHVRRLPERRNYLLACGLDDALHCLERLRFEKRALEHLASLGVFDDDFLSWLGKLRFRGEVRAVPEGTPLFADEPLVEVRASMPEAQLAETLLMNQVHFQTVIASKAARAGHAARRRRLVDFGLRRTHGGSSRRGRLTSLGSAPRATSSPAGSTACLWPAPWPTATFRRTTARATPSGGSRGSTRTRSCWWTPTGR
jgi:putative nicotinate phosphoribosyltransferase